MLPGTSDVDPTILPGVSPAPVIPEHSPRGPVRGTSDAWTQPTLGETARRLMEYRRFVIGLPLAVAVLSVIIVMFIPRQYDATTSFMAEQTSKGGLDANLSGLAATAGLLLGGGEGKSPLYYAAVLRSREVIEEVLQAKYPSRAGATDSVTLLDRWKVLPKAELRRRLDAGVRKLDKKMDVAVDRQVGSVTVKVRDKDAALAADVANRLVATLNRFNLERRQSRAQRRREFVESRAQEALSQLNQSESALRGFQERNRQWRSSPALELEYDRLKRQIDLNKDVYLSLRHEYETARMEEVNDIPVITVLDRAIPPVRKAFPPRAIIVFAATLIAALVAIFAVILAGDRLRELLGPKWAGAADGTSLRPA